uniref:PDXDC1/PDXD2 second domain-containing protein n=1 Tax=Oncorhynchus tshawytscha TaxID=74940 RepID=A0A8C8CR91_ONCTS
MTQHSAYYHEDDREGLLKVCRLVLNTRYEDYSTEGYTVLNSRQPVIYQSATCRPGLGQHLCSQLGLPLSSLCTVPCNTMFGSQHQMDIALLDKLIREDVETGKLPLLLIANAGTPGAGHTDKLGRLKELCEQYGMWLHIEGVNLATLALWEVSSPVMAATRSDSMTLTLGPWLGLPAVPAVTLYRHEDPALSLAAGLTSSQPVEKLRALPLWLSLQYLGQDGIVEKIRHAVMILDVWNLTCVSLTFPVLQVEDELNSPVVVFRFSQETSAGEWVNITLPGYFAGEREVLDSLNRWLCERLAQLVPASGVDIVELEDEGTCVRFTPLMTAAGNTHTHHKERHTLTCKINIHMKGIQEAELQLQKDNQDKLMEEGVLRQIPLVGSVLNWFSPFQSTVKGRTFNLAAGSLDSTEPTYSMKAQTGGLASPETPTSSAKRLPGQRLFRREGAGGSDSHSETSSVGQAEDFSRERFPQPTPPSPVPDEAVSVVPESPETPQVPAEPEPTQENGEVGTQEEERQPDGQDAPVEETGR